MIWFIYLLSDLFNDLLISGLIEWLIDWLILWLLNWLIRILRNNYRGPGHEMPAFEEMRLCDVKGVNTEEPR